MADKESGPLGTEEGGEAQKRAEMADHGQETHPKQVQGPAFASAANPQVILTPGQGYLGQQQAALLPHQGHQGFGVSTGGYPYQGLPMAPLQAGQLHYNLPPASQAAANIGQPPALQMSVGAFGGATIRIQSPALAAGGLVAGASAAVAFAASKVADSAAGVVGAGLVAGVATGVTTLASFYLSNRQQTDEAIRRAVERERHIQVENIEEGSLLVHVKFLTLAGYWVIRSFNEKIDKRTDRTCLQLLLEDELWRIGWTGPIQVGLEGWWFAEEEGQEEEETAETEQEERWEWAGMETLSIPPSVTTEADSGLPEDVSSVAAMSITSAGEVEEGPLKWLRAILQKHKDLPTAQRYIKAYRSWEEGAELLTSNFTSRVLFEESWLNLNKARLKKLMTSQLQADPTDSTCLLLTALQLPYGDSLVQALQQVVDAILQHGPETGCTNTCTTSIATWDHLETVYNTAELSKEVSETEAIRQFEHFLRLAPECDFHVRHAHYYLATLYNQQQDRQKVIHHFTRGQQTEANRLPVCGEVPRFIKDPATEAYEQVMLKKQANN
ncbi:hypothetical protein Bbelb_248150 [Branchiostoma belcheri]|nr:hypothetical protein Bbelb_248150 [Branchiostoma belcheri]